MRRAGGRAGRGRWPALALAAAVLAASCSGADDATGAGPDLGATTPPEPAAAGGVVGLLAACPAEDLVEDPPASQDLVTAVGVDDPAVTGIGDPALPDLGDPRLDVLAYDLSLSVDPASARVEAAVARLTVTATTPTAEVALDLVGLDVGAVTVDGEPVGATRQGAKLVVPLGAALGPGEEAVVVVCYAGAPSGVASPAIYGAPVGWNAASAGAFVLSEPEGARTWYPVNDHPTDKATYRFRVTVPPGQAAVANGVLVSGPVACTGDTGPGDPPELAAVPCGGAGEVGAEATTTWVWEMAAPMAPYLATVVVGDLERTVLDPVDGTPVEVWLPRGSPPPTVEALESSSAALAFVARQVGPYPFAAYGGVVVPGRAEASVFDNVALETQAMSLYGADAALPSVVVHETAHQWIGDSVSVESWSRDLWWVEGFATYVEWLWVEERSGEEEYVGFVLAAEESIGAETDPIGDLSAEALFTPLPYQGGALVFHALRRAMGDEAFGAFLSTFADRYRHATASTEDLVATASEVAGRDLAPLVASWLGPPRDRPTAPS